MELRRDFEAFAAADSPVALAVAGRGVTASKARGEETSDIVLINGFQ